MNNKDHKIIWQNCLNAIKKEISQQNYQTWFKPIIPQKYENNTLTISVPNQFFYEWIEGNYVALLQKVLHQELGPNSKLTYQINQTSTNNPKPTPEAPKKNTLKTNLPTQEQIQPINPQFTFQNFIVGDSNQLAQAATQAIANNPGKISFNPLLIYSKVGLGKTHLAQALITYIHTQHPNLKVLYITAEKFTTLFIQKILENNPQTIIDEYGTLDIFVIDDIQFLSKKEKTQEIFFHIFNILHQKGKQIFMTSDAPPSDLQGFEKRLLSRFKWGLVVDIKQPNLETKTAIIHSKLQQHNFHLENNIIDYIATQHTTNIREIEGIITSLIAYTNLVKQPIDKNTVQQIIDKIISPNSAEQELNIQYLQKTVATHLKIPQENIKKKSRKKEIVLPRQLIMYLMRKYTHTSLKSIGNLLGHKDHSTVSYACNTIRNLMQTNKHFRSQVEEIEKNIRQDFPQLS